MKNIALIVAGLIFSIVSIVHFVRFARHFEIVIGQFQIPDQWSLYGGVVSGILAIWMFVAAAKSST